TSATAGISVSGRAVPTAASRLPTAASERLKWWPAHSTPLVNISEPARMTAKLTSRMAICIGKGRHLGLYGRDGATIRNRARPASVWTLKEAIKAGNGAAICRMRESKIVAKLELRGG